MPFTDFSAVKEAVSLADAIQFLGVQLKRSGNQWRGPCPTCQSGGDRALVVTDGRGYYCFADKKGGDVIAFAAHILKVPVKDAAHELASRAGLIDRSPTLPREREAKDKKSDPPKGMQPLDYLEHDHDAVIAMGFDPAFCEEHGIGWAGKGIMRGTVAIPFRDETGKLLGYLGASEPLTLPADFKGNIVPFDRKRA